MTRIQCRADYFKVTAEEGDHGLLGAKIEAICKEVPEGERETRIGRTHVNLTILPSPVGSNLLIGKVFQSRNDNISKRRRGTTVSQPIDLDEDEDVDETSYFVYCPETSLIGVAYNYHGPKISLIIGVINKLYRENIDTKEKRSGYIIVQRGEAIKKILEQSEIRGVTARLKDPGSDANANLNADVPEVFGAFKAPRETTLEVTIKAKKRGGMVMFIDEFRKKFFRKESDLDLYDVFKVDATDDKTGTMKTYDLLNDKLQEPFTVELEADNKTYVEQDMVNRLTILTNSVKERYSY